MSAQATTPGQNHQGHWQALVILVLPLVVIGLSTALYFSGIWHPDKQVQNGYLVQPVLPVSGLFSEGNLPAEITGGRQWQLLLSVPAGCDQQCDYWRHQLRQIKVALGKNQARVNGAVLSLIPEPESSRPALPWVRISQPLQMTPSLESQMRVRTDQAVIWIADPEGNLVMYYDAFQSPDAILTDLKRLLKLSLIG